MVLPDLFLDHDTPPAMYAKAGLDANGIVGQGFRCFRDAIAPELKPADIAVLAERAQRRRTTGPTAEDKWRRGMKVILAKPRGFCAGVVRAIEIVERALDKYGPPVYVRHEIVHNKWVVDALKARGARFVEDSPRCRRMPSRSSARTASRRCRADAAERGLRVLNATCPLVSKVHSQGRHYLRNGRTVILIGHADIRRSKGRSARFQAGPAGADGTRRRCARFADDTPVAYVTQTTLSVDDTRGIIAALFRRFTDVIGPGTQISVMRRKIARRRC